MIVVILLIVCFNCIDTFAFYFNEIWKGHAEKRAITDLKAIDINKNGIKELIVICNYSTPLEKYALSHETYGYIKLYEWNSSTLVKKWGYPEITIRPSASVVEVDDQEFLQVGTFSLNVLHYKNDKYILEELNKSKKPNWPDERIFAKGSFAKKSSKDIIVTIYSENRNYHIRHREARIPNTIIWTSPVLIKGTGAVVFGDFNKDGKIELLMESGYWINLEGKDFKINEIKNYKKNEYGTPLPLFKVVGTSEPGVKYFKSGRTINKDFDDVFYLEPSPYPYDYGEYLIKAMWKKDRFEYEKILSAKKNTKSGEFAVFKNFDLVDLDNDGLEEIIVTEASGKFVPTQDEPGITDYKENILILKWNTKKYEMVFTSHKFKGNTSLLIDDITGDGKKEIIVGNEKGELYIFGQN
jgi:hypothetical protein